MKLQWLLLSLLALLCSLVQAGVEDSSSGITTVMEFFNNPFGSGSLTFTETYTLLSGNPVSTFVETVWATDTDTAHDAVPLTTPITLPVSTVTITVSAVFTSISTSVATSVTASVAASASTSASTFVYATTARPERCIVPGGGGTYPLACADTVLNTPTVTPTMINGTVVPTIQKSAAIPLGANNLFKPIAARLKAVFSLGMGSGKMIAPRSYSLCLAQNGDYFVPCPFPVTQKSPNSTADAIQKSAAMSLDASNLFKPIVDGVKMVFSFGFAFRNEESAGRWPFISGQEWVEACFKVPKIHSPTNVPRSPYPTGLPLPQTDTDQQASTLSTQKSSL